MKHAVLARDELGRPPKEDRHDGESHQGPFAGYRQERREQARAQHDDADGDEHVVAAADQAHVFIDAGGVGRPGAAGERHQPVALFDIDDPAVDRFVQLVARQHEAVSPCRALRPIGAGNA